MLIDFFHITLKNCRGIKSGSSSSSNNIRPYDFIHKRNARYQHFASSSFRLSDSNRTECKKLEKVSSLCCAYQMNEKCLKFTKLFSVSFSFYKYNMYFSLTLFFCVLLDDTENCTQNMCLLLKHREKKFGIFLLLLDNIF